VSSLDRPIDESQERARHMRAAAEHAVAHVRSGMVVGLGEGSTARYAIAQIASLLARGALSDILGVPCSRGVANAASELGIPLTTLEAHPVIDLTIDGADEVDPTFTLIKGGGGALLHEKIVAQASRREIIVVDASKRSPLVGTRHALPVEVVPFGWRSEARYLETLGGQPRLRSGPTGAPFRTDEDNVILDCDFGPISNARELSRLLSERAGIVEHGLFIDLATDLIVADASGARHLKRPEETSS
jgi:ribose 5-phosphate isomerase A